MTSCSGLGTLHRVDFLFASDIGPDVKSKGRGC